MGNGAAGVIRLGTVEPGVFGLGPIPAVRQALERPCWKIGDIEPIEINEAFATAMAVMRERPSHNDWLRRVGRLADRTV